MQLKHIIDLENTIYLVDSYSYITSIKFCEQERASLKKSLLVSKA